MRVDSLPIDIVTIFPEYLAPLRQSLLGKAAERGLVRITVHDRRQWTDEVHRTVDDTPYGGGPGMVLRREPWGRPIRPTTTVSGASWSVLSARRCRRRRPADRGRRRRP